MRPPAAEDRQTEVLIVHEDEEARDEIRQCLEQRSIRCRDADSAAEALRTALALPPDLVILDLDLPDQSGLGLCRRIRDSESLARLPVIVVSSHASEIHKVLAFEAGVDDFVARPFFPPELGARVLAVLRSLTREHRTRGPSGVFETGSLSIDTDGGRVAVCGRRVDFTPKEFALLSTLVSQSGRVVKRRQLVERLWGDRAPGNDRVIDAHIKSIRRKLGDARRCIETVRGVGYRFSEELAARSS